MHYIVVNLWGGEWFLVGPLPGEQLLFHLILTMLFGAHGSKHNGLPATLSLAWQAANEDLQAVHQHDIKVVHDNALYDVCLQRRGTTLST